MTHSSRSSILLLLVCLLLTFTWLGCKAPGKNEPTIKPPSLGATSVSEVKNTTAKVTCPIREVGFGVTGSSTIKEYGICYATKELPTTNDPKISVGTSATATLDIAANLTGLLPGTSYFVRGYVVHDGGTVYGDQAKFTTESLKAPELTIADATDQNTTAFTITGKLTSLGTSDVTQHGHVLSATNQTPTTADTKTEMGLATAVPKDFKSVFTALKPNTTYYVRAYAINATGTGYSDAKTIKTSAEAAPTVTIADATDLTSSNFSITGRVGSVGTSDVTQMGHCLSETNQNPTTGDTKTETGGTNAPKDFRSNFGSLKANTTYYVRAYATSPVGTGYSDVKTVKTANEVAPTVVTQGIDQVSINTARATGTVTNAGTRGITQYGHCWSRDNQTPTTNDSKSEFGATNTPRDYATGMTNLAQKTAYYVRAYAISPAGTSYGDMKSFTTLDIVLPVLTTPVQTSPPITVFIDPATNILLNSQVSSLGTFPATEFGYCYSTTNQTPTTSDAKRVYGGTTPGVGGVIPATITGLSPNTTYYVRAYAITSGGTGYSPVGTFKTANPTPPTVAGISVNTNGIGVCNTRLSSWYQLDQKYDFTRLFLPTCNEAGDNNSFVLPVAMTISFTYSATNDPISSIGICYVRTTGVTGFSNPDPTINSSKLDLTGQSVTHNTSSRTFTAQLNVRTFGTRSIPCNGRFASNGTLVERSYTNYLLRPYVSRLGFGTTPPTYSDGHKVRSYIVGQSGAVYYGPVVLTSILRDNCDVCFCTGPGSMPIDVPQPTSTRNAKSQ